MGLLKSVLKKVVFAAAVVVGNRVAAKVAGKVREKLDKPPPLPNRE